MSLPFVLPSPFSPPFPFDPAFTCKWPQFESEKRTFFLFFSLIHFNLQLLSSSTQVKEQLELGSWGRKRAQLHLLITVYLLIISPEKKQFLPIFWVGFFYFSGWSSALCFSFSLFFPGLCSPFSPSFFLSLTQSSLHSQLLSLKLLHSSLKHAALQVEQHISVQL